MNELINSIAAHAKDPRKAARKLVARAGRMSDRCAIDWLVELESKIKTKLCTPS